MIKLCRYPLLSSNVRYRQGTASSLLLSSARASVADGSAVAAPGVCCSSKKLNYTTMTAPKKICIVGSGNWGSAIAKIIGANTVKFPDFENEVKMWVFEEMIDGQKLTEIINTKHENVKYLPGHTLPSNVVAVPELLDAAKDADILVFVIPHQFIKRALGPIVGKLKAGCVGLSLIKGLDYTESGIQLISKSIKDIINIPIHVLMGANLAGEVADDKFCETTIGCKDQATGRILRDMIQTDNFRVVVVDDSEAVELCGALKNVVATGAGFVDGLGYGDNTKAAIIRLGLMETIKFCEVFYPGSKLGTFFESCGVADLITTCYGGRNRKVAEAFVKTGKTIEELEKEMLNGQKLQGPETAIEVGKMLRAQKKAEVFPLFTAVDRICRYELKPADMISMIRIHPEHMCTFDKQGLPC